MKVSKLNLIRHISLIIFLTALLALGIAYPFLTGDYDRLAMPISTMIQVFGLVGLSLVPVGILWLTIPKYMFGFAIAAPKLKEAIEPFGFKSFSSSQCHDIDSDPL